MLSFTIDQLSTDNRYLPPLLLPLLLPLLPLSLLLLLLQHEHSRAAEVALPTQSPLQTEKPETNSQIPVAEIQAKSKLNR